jgi:hypothetical protein
MPVPRCARGALQSSAAAIQVAVLLLLTLLGAIAIRAVAPPARSAATQTIAAPDGFGWDRGYRLAE